MTEMFGCLFEVKSAEFLEFIDNSEQFRNIGDVTAEQRVVPDWISSRSENTVVLMLHVQWKLKHTQRIMVQLTLKIEFTVLGGGANPAESDGMALPQELLYTLAGIAWAHVMIKLKTQTTPIGGITFPPATPEQLFPASRFPGFSLN